MKRPSEMESDSLTMQILGSVDLLTLIAADLTPPQLAPLMSTSKLVRQGCLCNAIWQRYVGGVPRPGALEGELYRSYKNLTQGNFLLDSAFPSDAFPSYSDFYDAWAGLLLIDNGTAICVVSSKDEIVQDKFELGEEDRVQWASFLDDKHIVIVSPIADPNARWIKPLKIIVLSIETGKVTATKNLPHVDHVSAFALHKPTSTLCFGEEVNAHIYCLTSGSVTEVAHFRPLKEEDESHAFSETKYDYCCHCAINEHFVILGNDSAILRCWKLSDGSYFSTSMGYCDYDRDSVSGLCITSNNDVIVPTMNVSGGGRNSSSMDIYRYRIEKKPNEPTKLQFAFAGFLKGLEKVDQQRLPIIELTGTSVLVGIDGRLLQLDWKRSKEVSYLEFSPDCLNTSVTREVPDYGSNVFFGLGKTTPIATDPGLKMKTVTEEHVFPVFRLFRDGETIYFQSKDTNAFYYRGMDVVRPYVHRISANVAEASSKGWKRERKSGWIFYPY